MKKIIFYFTFLFISHFCFTQNVSVTELLKMHTCSNYECAKELIIANAYTYTSSPIIEPGKAGYLYSHPVGKDLTTSDQNTIKVYHSIVYELNETSADAHYVYAMALGRINENASSRQKIASRPEL